MEIKIGVVRLPVDERRGLLVTNRSWERTRKGPARALPTSGVWISILQNLERWISVILHYPVHDSLLRKP